MDLHIRTGEERFDHFVKNGGFFRVLSDGGDDLAFGDRVECRTDRMIANQILDLATNGDETDFVGTANDAPHAEMLLFSGSVARGAERFHRAVIDAILRIGKRDRLLFDVPAFSDVSGPFAPAAFVSLEPRDLALFDEPERVQDLVRLTSERVHSPKEQNAIVLHRRKRSSLDLVDSFRVVVLRGTPSGSGKFVPERPRGIENDYTRKLILRGHRGIQQRMIFISAHLALNPREIRTGSFCAAFFVLGLSFRHLSGSSKNEPMSAMLRDTRAPPHAFKNARP